MVRFNLDKKEEGQLSPIFLSLFHHGKRLRVYTGKKIDAVKWDVKTRRANPMKYKTNCPGFNIFLQGIDDAVTSLINENKPISKADLLTIIKKANGKQTSETFFGFADEFLPTQLAKGEIKPSSAKGYRTAINHLKEFKPSLTFHEIDLNFYDKYVTYLKGLGLSTNSIGTNIKRMKWFLSAALDRDHHTNLSFKKKSFKTVTEETDQIYLTRKEIRQFEQKNMPARLKRVADAFIINTYLGQRYSDWVKLLPENISKESDGYKWNFVQQKGKQNQQIKITVPIPDEALPLLKRYKFSCPVLNAKGKLISVQKYNEYLKEAAQIAELNSLEEIRHGGKSEKFAKFDLIKSHTSRRSFATNLFLEEVPIQNIMAITGHKLESTFVLYVRANQLTKAKGLAKHYQQKQKPTMKVSRGGKAAA